MDIDDVRDDLQNKKILDIDYEDEWDGNIINMILEDGSKIQFSSLTGISVDVKKRNRRNSEWVWI